MRQAFIDTLVELAALDARIWLIVGDVGFSLVEPFAKRFPERFINVGVAEQQMTGLAAGLARCGKVVFTYSIANFPVFRCLEQIRNDVCYHRCNVKIVAVGGGFSYGSQGYTHHAVEDLAILRPLPGMAIMAPGDWVEARGATRAIAGREGPCYLRLGKSRGPILHAKNVEVKLGCAILARPGTDVTLITTGGTLAYALDVADQCAKRGIAVRVVSMPSIKPFDWKAVVRSAQETHGIITVEDHTVTGGLGDAVASVLCTMRQGFVPFHKVGVADEASFQVGEAGYLTSFLSSVPRLVDQIIAGSKDYQCEVE